MTLSVGNKIKILHLVNKWDKGGVERYIESIVSKLSSDCFEFHIASVTSTVNTHASCSVSGPISSCDSPAKAILNRRDIRLFLEQGGFDVVHIHTNNGTGFLYAALAKNAGVEKVIVHSHNSSFGGNHQKAKRFVSHVLKTLYGSACTDRWACSVVAGRHLFGNGEFVVMRNGVDTARFKYSPIARETIRKTLGVDQSDYLVGFVASFAPAKNVSRVVSVFDSLLKRRFFDTPVKLVIVGDGEERSLLENAIDEHGIRRYCTIVGFVSNPEDYYSALDILLAPSYYEGLPLNLVEAQACNLPILASDAITSEVVLRDSMFSRLSLSLNDSAWVDELCAIAGDSAGKDRSSRDDFLSRRGYDLAETTKELKREYLRGFCDED